MHVVVAYYNPLSCCIYTAVVSWGFDTVIKPLFTKKKHFYTCFTRYSLVMQFCCKTPAVRGHVNSTCQITRQSCSTTCTWAC